MHSNALLTVLRYVLSKGLLTPSVSVSGSINILNGMLLTLGVYVTIEIQYNPS